MEVSIPSHTSRLGYCRVKLCRTNGQSAHGLGKLSDHLTGYPRGLAGQCRPPGLHGQALAKIQEPSKCGSYFGTPSVYSTEQPGDVRPGRRACAPSRTAAQGSPRFSSSGSTSPHRTCICRTGCGRLTGGQPIEASRRATFGGTPAPPTGTRVALLSRAHS